MFNEQMREQLKKYLTAEMAGPLPPGSNAIAQAGMDKIGGYLKGFGSEIGEDANKPAPGPSYPLNQTPPTPPTPAPMPTPAAAPVAAAPAPAAAPAMPTPPTPAPVVSQPTQPDPLSGYNDAARQQLYAQLAARKKEGAGWAAAAGLGDMARSMAGAAPINAQENIQNQLNNNDKTARAQFEAGREGKIQDITTGLALKKAGREETEYNDQNTPSSQMSRLAVGFATKMLGPDKVKQLGFDSGKATYADVVKILPIVEKYVVGEQTKADRAKKEGESLYQKKLQQLESIRGDTPLKNSEVQRDAAAIAYRSLAENKARTGSYSQNPVDYIDTLGQLYKARTGQAPTDTTFKHLVQDWSGGNINKVATFLTGQQLSTSSNDIGGSLMEMVQRMGDQADTQHEGYMTTRVDTRGLSPDDAQAFSKIAKRGYSYADQRQQIDDMLKSHGTTTTQTGATGKASSGWKVIR